MRKLEFFKNKRYITQMEYKELSLSLDYLEIKKDENIIEYGDEGDLFYIILSGEVKVEVPNPNIKDWSWARSIYQSLYNWKKNVFDSNV